MNHTEAVDIALITTLGAVLVAIIGVMAEGFRRQSTALRGVREQSNTTAAMVGIDPLEIKHHLGAVSEDIKVLLAAFRGLEGDIRALRSELGHERKERLAVSDRVEVLSTSGRTRPRGTRLKETK